MVLALAKPQNKRAQGHGGPIPLRHEQENPLDHSRLQNKKESPSFLLQPGYSKCGLQISTWRCHLGAGSSCRLACPSRNSPAITACHFTRPLGIGALSLERQGSTAVVFELKSAKTSFGGLMKTEHHWAPRPDLLILMWSRA